MAEDDCDGEDMVSLGQEVLPGIQVGVRHRPDHSTEPGFYSRAVEGQPIPPGAELVFLDKEDEHGRRRVKGSFANRSSGEGPRAAGDGPAQVATEAYRSGYDRIFGRQKVGQA